MYLFRLIHDCESPQPLFGRYEARRAMARSDKSAKSRTWAARHTLAVEEVEQGGVEQRWILQERKVADVR
jgi:hypothetical protein